MAEVVWTDPALEDLDAVADYIALDKPEAARRFVQRVFARVEELEKFPRKGSIPPETPGLPHRQVVVPPCRVFYRFDGSSVFVLHVMRGERLLRTGTLEERDSR